MAVTSTYAADIPLSFGFAGTIIRLFSYRTSVIITDKSSVCNENGGGVPGAYYSSGELVLAYLQRHLQFNIYTAVLWKH